jgi:hypothetical protein
MSYLGRKIAQFAGSPRGQRLIAQIRGYAARPENQRKIDNLRNRLQSRGGR